MKATRLIIILAVGLGLGGFCYLGIRRYENILTWRSYCFELRDPCHPKGLSTAEAQALPSDDTIQQELPGTWWHSQCTRYSDDKLVWYVSRVVVASNGDYAGHVTSLNGAVRSNAIQGHWRVRSGLLFDTITNYHFSFTNERVLHVFTNQILRLTDRELIFRDCQDSDDVELFRRVKQVHPHE
jgi:hypothetical protein